MNLLAALRSILFGLMIFGAQAVFASEDEPYLHVIVTCDDDFLPGESTLFITRKGLGYSVIEIKHITDQDPNFCELIEKYANFNLIAGSNLKLELCLGYDIKDSKGTLYAAHIGIDGSIRESTTYQLFESQESCHAEADLSGF